MRQRAVWRPGSVGAVGGVTITPLVRQLPGRDVRPLLTGLPPAGRGGGAPERRGAGT